MLCTPERGNRFNDPQGIEARFRAGQSRHPALNPSFLKTKDSNVPPMPVRVHHIAAILALALAGVALGGCSSINEKLSAGVGDTLPQWAGGLPPDVPPRRGTPEYEAYMKERERKRLEPAASNSNASLPASTSPAASAQPLDPVH